MVQRFWPPECHPPCGVPWAAATVRYYKYHGVFGVLQVMLLLMMMMMMMISPPPHTFGGGRCHGSRDHTLMITYRYNI